MRWLALWCVLGLASVGGCASYEYNLVEPAPLARHIGAKQPVQVDVDPLQYRMQSLDSRLILHIYNPTPDTIELLGPRSTVVDPRGQSHPLQPQTLAPSSYVRLIFPPPRPQVERSGPSLGIGFGIHSSRHEVGRYRPSHDAFADEPRYFDVYDPNDPYLWDWPGGEGQIRVNLAFRRGEKTFTHSFVFTRQK